MRLPKADVRISLPHQKKSLAGLIFSEILGKMNLNISSGKAVCGMMYPYITLAAHEARTNGQDADDLKNVKD